MYIQLYWLLCLLLIRRTHSLRISLHFMTSKLCPLPPAFEKQCNMEKRDNSQSLRNEGHGQMSRQFTGVRLRKWGSWVSEVRMPKCRQKLWLGSYKTAEQAARAYDAAVYYLRGPAAKFNFPDSVPLIPPALSLSSRQIQAAAVKYASGEVHSTVPSLHSNKEEPAFPSLVRENQQISEEEAVWNSLFAGSDGAECLNFDIFPEASALDLIPTSDEGYIFIDPTELWNF